jgi:hypothetical protein
MSLRQTRLERVFVSRVSKGEINHVALLPFPIREFEDLIAILRSENWRERRLLRLL